MRFATRRFRRLVWTALVIALVLPTALPTDEGKVKQLQKDRLAVLTRIVDGKERAYRHGEVSLSDYSSAYQQMFEAELAICDNDAERIKVREKMLERAKADEELASRGVRAGEATEWDRLAVVARRLAIEIALERLKK
jgi:outer membrane protein TolC